MAMRYLLVCVALLGLISEPSLGAKSSSSNPIGAQNLLAIDLGGDFLKLSIVQAGRIPISVVSNEMSKRKTPALVGMVKGERVLGEEAVTLSGRYPKDVYMRVRDMSTIYDSKDMDSFLQHNYLNYRIKESNRSSLFGIESDTGDVQTLEELLASILYYAQVTAQKTSNQLLQQCVIIVPPYYGPRQRQAIFDAAKLVGLKIMSLVNSNAAAALQYGITRVFDEPTNIIIYDVGGSDVVASLVRYSHYTVKQKNVKDTKEYQLEVVDVVTDDSIGATDLDLALMTHFGKEFEAKHKGSSVFKNERALAKLRKAVRKTKEVLSSNQVSPINVQELADQHDFSSQISRADFEKLVDPILTQMAEPLKKLLERNSDIPLSSISTVELVGGGSRVGKLHTKLQKILDGKALDHHIDADEGMVMGAGLIAANLSKTFRLRKFGLSDGSMYAVNFTVLNKPGDKASDSAPAEFYAPKQLLPPMKRLPIARAVSYSNVTIDPIKIALVYDTEAGATPRGMRDDKVLMSLEVSGLAEVQEKHGSTGKLQLHYKINKSGMVEVGKAETSLNVTKEVETTDYKTMSRAEAEALGEQAEILGPAKNTTKSGNSTADGDKETKDTADKENENMVRVKVKTKSEQPVTIKESLNVTVVLDSAAGLNDKQVEESKLLLMAMVKRELNKQQASEVRNQLESLILSFRPKLDEDELLIKVTTQEQRDDVKSQLTTVEDWLYTEAKDNELEPFQTQYQALKKVIDKIQHRASELTERGNAIKMAKQGVELMLKAMNTWEEMRPWITKEEKADINDQLQEFGEWLSRKENEQEQLKLHEDPAFTSTMVISKLAPTKSAFDKLNNRRNPNLIKKDSAKAGKGKGLKGDGGPDILDFNNMDWEGLKQKLGPEAVEKLQELRRKDMESKQDSKGTGEKTEGEKAEKKEGVKAEKTEGKDSEVQEGGKEAGEGEKDEGEQKVEL